MDRADVVVHGATGFTGRLVCAALARRGISFAAAGRSKEKLERLAHDVGASEVCVVDVTRGASLEAAFKDRKIVLACAGPFAEVGEPALATCARLGVHYADTTGEQSFVADAVARYAATAEASGACVVPAMAYEIAPADWAAHLAAKKLDGPPDEIEILYATRPKGRATASTSRGTKLSMLNMAADGRARQYVGGTLVHEPPAEIVASFPLHDGRRVTGASFPSPEAVVVPQHTRARTVRTFMAMGSRGARTLHAVRRVVPNVARMIGPMVARRVAKSSTEGPEGEARHAEFQIVAQAKREGRVVHVFVRGEDPYGLTAEIQAYAAERATKGEITARGVVAPSVAFEPRAGFEALATFGVSVA
jgi:short subunit dehydrogenase-like uncharacterized protein